MSTALKLFWSPERGDNFTETTADGERDALAARYVFIRHEGYAFPSSQPNTVPLRLYWNPFRGDNLTTATEDGEKSALAAGYSYVRDEGYVYPTEQPGTVPLKLFWSPGRADNFTTATAQGEQDALNAGYQFIRVEGYVSPRPTDIAIDLHSDLGANHFMDTHGTLLKTGHIDATTRTRTETLLGGFHGGVAITLQDANGITIGATTKPHVFGVDGTMIGRSDRTDYWSEDIGPALAERATAIHVYHFWAPQYQAVQTVVDRAVAAAKPVIEVLKEIKSLGGDGK
jgi:hypothetical protein